MNTSTATFVFGGFGLGVFWLLPPFIAAATLVLYWVYSHHRGDPEWVREHPGHPSVWLLFRRLMSLCFVASLILAVARTALCFREAF